MTAASEKPVQNMSVAIDEGDELWYTQFSLGASQNMSIAIDEGDELWYTQFSLGATDKERMFISYHPSCRGCKRTRHLHPVVKTEMIWCSDNMYGNRTDLNLGTYMSSSPTLSADENEVFITTFVGNDVAIYSLNPLNGAVNWFKLVENKETAFSSVAIYKEVVLVAFDEQIYAFHTSDKEADQDEQQEHYHPGWIAWIYNSTIVGGNSNVNKIQSTLAIDEENGFAYFGTGNSKSIICLDLKANATTNYTNINNDVNDADYMVDNAVWTFSVNGLAFSSTALDLENKLLYFVAANGLYCLTIKDPYLTDGIIRDTQARLLYYLNVPTGGLLSAALSLDLERVVIATTDRRIVSIDVTVLHTIDRLGGSIPGTNNSIQYNESNTVNLVWDFSVDASVQIISPVMDIKNNIYVATQRGTIYGIASNTYLANDLFITPKVLDERPELLWKFESNLSGGLFISGVLISNLRMLFSILSDILGIQSTPSPVSPPRQGSTSSIGAFGSANTAILVSGLLIFIVVGCGLGIFFAARRKKQNKDLAHHRRETSGTAASSSGDLHHSVMLIKDDGNTNKCDTMMGSATIEDSSSYMRTTTSSKSIRKPSMNAIAGGLPSTRVYKLPYAHHGLPSRSGMVVGVTSLEANCDNNSSDDGLLDSPASTVSSLAFTESSKVLPPHPGHVHFRYNTLQQEARRGNTQHAVPSFAVIGSGLHITVNANEDNVVSNNRKLHLPLRGGGIQGLHNIMKGMGHTKINVPIATVDPHKERWWGVDISTLFFFALSSAEFQEDGTPLQWESRLIALLKSIPLNLIIIFDGERTNIKSVTHMKRSERASAAFNKAQDCMQARARLQGGSNDEAQVIINKKIRGHLLAAFRMDHVRRDKFRRELERETNYPTLVAPGEADHQIVAMLQSKQISAVISVDSDLFCSSAEMQISKIRIIARKLVVDIVSRKFDVPTSPKMPTTADMTKELINYMEKGNGTYKLLFRFPHCYHHRLLY